MAFLRSDRLSFGSGLKLFRQIDVPLSIPQGGATGSGALRVTGLRALADRIQARAVRRMGELLKQFDGKGNNQHSAEGKVVALPTQKEAAQSAGLSEHQIKQAVRVANVPAEKFEAAIEAVLNQAGCA